MSSQAGAGQKIVIVENDTGGSVKQRQLIVSNYRQTHTVVEIRGRYCLSACTMYLGLMDVCVSPDTVFGFHGPSSEHFGIGLTPRAFKHWSQIMADHYPEPIRTWFLQTGRNRTVGFHLVAGSHLIEIGAKACAEI